MVEQDWNWVQTERIPSDTSEGRKIVADLLDHLDRQQWDDNDRFAVHLAFEEALVNAIKHGNSMDREKNVEITMRTSSDQVAIEIRDEGTGFDPSAVPDPTEEENLENPSGRGIMLMQNFMTSVKYNDDGNHVVMIKQRSS